MEPVDNKKKTPQKRTALKPKRRSQGFSHTEEAKPSRKGNAVYLIVQLLVVATALTALVILGIGLGKKLFPHREPVEVLENRIREIQELALVRQIYRDVIYARAGGVFSSEILFSIDYHIVAGINLSRGVQIKQNKDGSLTAVLPEPEILSVDAKDESVVQYYIKESFRAVRQGDYMPLIVAEKKALTDSAVQAGILLRARRNGEILLLKLFKLSGYDTVRFEYLPSAPESEETS